MSEPNSPKPKKPSARRVRAQEREKAKVSGLCLVSLNQWLTELRIPNDWDLLLIGDGSGSGWHIGCGWGCLAIENITNRRKWLWGGLSTGTVQIAELMPYVHALGWYNFNHAETYRKSFNKTLLKVQVISDSESTVKQGSYEISRKDRLMWWAAWETILREGYQARFKYIPRETSASNYLCDMISKSSRKNLSEGRVFAPIVEALGEDFTSPYFANYTESPRTQT